MDKRYFFTIAFISWMMFVTFSSLSSFEGVKTPRFDIPHLDKAVHFSFYFVACVLGVLFLRERSKGSMPMAKAIVLMVIATVIFGAIIEVLQYTLTENREGDYWDALANTLGSLLGALAFKVYFSSKRQLKWKY